MMGIVKMPREQEAMKNCGGFALIPFFLQQEVPDVAMLDPVAAHVKFVQGDNILGEIIPDARKGAELPPDGIFRGQQVGNLDIQLVSFVLAHEVDLFVGDFADRDRIAPAQQLHVDDIFQHKVDIFLTMSFNSTELNKSRRY